MNAPGISVLNNDNLSRLNFLSNEYNDSLDSTFLASQVDGEINRCSSTVLYQSDKEVE